MALDRATVKKIALLARIKVPESELDSLAGELSSILTWVEQLNKIDTGNVQPMAGGGHLALPKRADAVTDGGAPEKVLANAPERVETYYAVPKVVE
ncbi:MAG: Asp-tRNA(Asn)/Glu-tRNA(Gln) amidotransferase subunit GatC [Rhodospirillales bacterium]|nr:Asp-tRNA(Asn)/Glu-tRNA(Gln) amidotransferase subunit GatC [Rhodospirillales bacterium]